MDLAVEFAYVPISNAPGSDPLPEPTSPPADNSDLGSLAQLPGVWKGTGFNAIWRPNFKTQDRFLELNVTEETLEFDRIPGNIPNRGLLQTDLFMTGVRYLQQIADSNVKGSDGKPAGLHIEPGLWLSIPETADPKVQASVARLASIPHGTTIVAQGPGFTVGGPPLISPVTLNPFPIGNPAGNFTFPEQNLAIDTLFRTSKSDIPGVDQAMIDNPNSVISDVATNQTITSTVVLQVTSDSVPILGGGTANTAFLAGGADGPNAVAATVTSTFWIETVQGQEQPQLQYTQTVLLNFAKLSWPHITVATLTKQS